MATTEPSNGSGLMIVGQVPVSPATPAGPDAARRMRQIASPAKRRVSPKAIHAIRAHFVRTQRDPFAGRPERADEALEEHR